MITLTLCIKCVYLRLEEAGDKVSAMMYEIEVVIDIILSLINLTLSDIYLYIMLIT